MHECNTSLRGKENVRRMRGDKRLVDAIAA
jgi:hypothetical protein